VLTSATNLIHLTFQLKSAKPVKAIRHLPINTPTEDKSNGVQDLGYSVFSVKQMTASRPSPEGGSHTLNLPLFLVTLPKNSKSQEIFQLNSLCHIVDRVEAYRTQNALTQCFSYQKLSYLGKLQTTNHLEACGVEAATFTRNAQNRVRRRQSRTAATAA